MAVAGTLSTAPSSQQSYVVGAKFSDRLTSGELGPEMIVVPARSFSTGSISALWRNDVRPPQTVTIIQPFAVARTEITVGQFRKFAAATGYRVEAGCWHHDADEVWRFDSHRNWQSPGFPQQDTHPVACISWHDALAYVQWLSRETGLNYRLPSESEFELFVDPDRRGAERPDSEICSIANGADIASPFTYRNRSCSDGNRYTAPVASFNASSFGLYDTRGNLWEWTEDCWTEGARSWWYLLSAAPSDGSAWHTDSCKYRSTRGGAWLSSINNLSIFVRRPSPPEYRLTSVGFRPVRDL